MRKGPVTLGKDELKRSIAMLEILSDRCAAAYQVVGALADYADIHADPAVVKAMDLLAFPLQRGSFSPFNPKKIQEKNLAESQRRQSAGKRRAVSRSTARPEPLCRYIAHHKTVAVAEILLASPRTAQEVLIVRTLNGLRLHEAFAALGKEAEARSAYRVLEEQARCFALRLGFEIEEGESVWRRFPPPFADELALYEAVRGLSDHDLAGLPTLLAALSFGQGNGERLDTSDSLFNRVARDLSVDMKNHGDRMPAFFGKRNREQLVGITKECG